ncbi:MAG: site-specific integrase [Candidatus Acidiferrales bacterium]
MTHPDGRGERRTIGNVTLKTAIQQRTIWQRELTEARYVKKVPRVERRSFAAIADAALEYAKKFKRSWDTDAGRIKRMKEWWGSRLADEITTAEVDARLYENVAPRGECWTETTSNEYRVLLSTIYSRAIERGELTVNPATEAHRYKLNNERTRELSYAEEDRLRKTIRELYPKKEPEFDLALHTGVRRSTLYGIHAKGRKEMPPLDWSSVNFDWKVITVPRAKSGKKYIVPLNAVALDALKILRERSDGTGPVIRKPSGLEIRSCRKWFENCLTKACIEDFRWHDLRHTFGTRLRRNGVPLEDVAALLDHGIPELRMTLRYAHADMDRLHQAVATLVRTDTNTDTRPVVEFRRAEAV